MRPSSIVRFDRLYLAAIAIGLVASVLEWPTTMARLATTPQTAALGSAGAAVAAAILAIGVALSLLVWFFAARRGSGIARWIAVVFTVIAVASLLLGIGNGTIGNDMAGFARMLAVAVQVVAMVNLFRADAAAWFAPVTPEEDA